MSRVAVTDPRGEGTTFAGEYPHVQIDEIVS